MIRKMLCLTGIIIVFSACTPTDSSIPDAAGTATATFLGDPDAWPDPCNPPDGYYKYINIDGGVTAYIVAWVDDNANAVVDEGESPLASVHFSCNGDCDTEITDANGKATLSTFVPGCICDCWKDDFVTLEQIPDGYYATTPIKQAMTGDYLTYYFGFKAIQPSE
jgi:hypothetical protein